MAGLVTPNLTTDLVADPSLHRMGLMVSEHGIDIVITSRVRDNELIYRHIDYPIGLESTFKALEEVVYANPLLTADFGHLDILLDTRRFFLVSADDADTIAERVEQLYPHDKTDFDIETVVNDVDGGRIRLVSVVERDVVRFLHRTFHNPTLTHRMTALTRYYGLRNHFGNSGKIHVRIAPNRTDVLAFGHSGLMMANTFDTTCAEDAVFFVVAATQRLGYDNDTDRVFVSGDRRLREAFVGSVRRFVTYAMPEIFPTALSRLGDGACDVPFEILVMPLCE